MQTYWHRSTSFLSSPEFWCSQKKDTKLGPSFRTKDLFSCGRSYKAVALLSQYYIICIQCQQFFWLGRWALGPICGLCLNHTVQKDSRRALETRIRVECTSKTVGNVNMAPTIRELAVKIFGWTNMDSHDLFRQSPFKTNANFRWQNYRCFYC